MTKTKCCRSYAKYSFKQPAIDDDGERAPKPDDSSGAQLEKTARCVQQGLVLDHGIDELV